MTSAIAAAVAAAVQRPASAVGSRQSVARVVGSFVGDPPTIRLAAKRSDTTNVFRLCDTLVENLLRSQEVVLSANGVRSALAVMELCALASKELNTVSGFLPGFGCLAFRLEKASAGPRRNVRIDNVPELASERGGTLRARVARLLDLPPPSPPGAPLVLVSRDSDPEELARFLTSRLRQQQHDDLSVEAISSGVAKIRSDDGAITVDPKPALAHPPEDIEKKMLVATVRLVGEGAANRLVRATIAAETVLRREMAAAAKESDDGGSQHVGSRAPRKDFGRLAVSPDLGVSLSGAGLHRQELLASIFWWSRPAPLLPNPAPPTLRLYWDK
eukprot:TRINITY_DN17417_c0_g1_i1.p1 TRINITY_DN17417_c0_g1~~TRINITY_DN17417_c0_g1_i1.p1  ORF type:complete len:330 (+),score=55.40 TRINITY_DN17417_c0_g1_i1:181-1170(+)